MASSRKTATNENVSTYGAAGQGRDYTAFATWEAATDIDLVTAAQSEVLECYDDAASFDDYTDLNGATTSSSYFRIIRPASAQGHDGTPANGFNIALTSDINAFWIKENYSQIQDIIAKLTLTGETADRTSFLAWDCHQGGYVGCIAYDSVYTSTTRKLKGFYVYQTGTNRPFCVNCLTHNMSVAGAGNATGFYGYNVDNSGYFYNCTADNNETYGFRSGLGTTITKNCCSSNNGTDWFGTITKTTCTAENATPVYEDSANDDFHLASGDTVCRGNGTDLSSDAVYPFDDDIDGETRSAWDIGFDEYSSAGTSIQDMKTDIKLAGWGRADAKLDLSAYYQKLEDAQLDISVQVWTLSHCVLDLSLADGIMLIDTILDLAAYYQKLEDAKLDIETWGDNTQDAKLDGMAAAWARKDQKIDMFAGVEKLESITMSIQSAREISNINAMLDMRISDGDSLQDNLLDIEITDGILLHDAGLDLAVIEIAPTFKAVYAMHLDSVITEI